MRPSFDYHTHTAHLKCANGTMTIPEIAAECARLGVTRLGITDHLNSTDKLPLHATIRRELQELDSPIDIWFGAELNFDGADGRFAFSREIRDEYGFSFAIGGIHSMYAEEYDVPKLIDIQHRHHLRTCRDPLADVLVHPYWYPKHEFDRRGWPWLDTMSVIPESYARELGQVARETGTAIEINAGANLVCGANPPEYADAYIDYLAAVAESGCLFSVGSDAHDIGRLATVTRAWDAVERLGLPPERLWHPPGKPITGPGAR